jgi:hypothetical protein
MQQKAGNNSLKTNRAMLSLVKAQAAMCRLQSQDFKAPMT